MENSSAVQRHEQSCIRAVFAFIWYSLGMKSAIPGPLRPGDEHLRHLSELPMKCIKSILSFTTPRDVCRLAAVCRLFRSAANSDSVWNKFIPPQFYQILSSGVTFSLCSSKRELYFRLCDSILIDGGTKRFWLERSTGKIGYMLSARAIWICFIDDRRYWNWVSRDDSRFDTGVAKLENVCWLDIRGGLDCRLLSPETEYSVVFRLRCTEDSHGWTGQPLIFVVTTPDGEEINSEHLLGKREGVASNGWIEVVAGEFTVRAAKDIQNNSASYLSFTMADVTSWWKGGLLIDGVKIEPSSSADKSREELRNFISRPLGNAQEEKHLKKLPELPKKCIKAILSFTTPRDVCRFAVVSRLARSAANSDSVWNKFIPPQCYQIQPSAFTFDLFSSKRELYFRLCDSILIKEERKRFFLERSTGKIGYILSARELNIDWGHDQRYWRWISQDDSRFGELAELLSVCWLDVWGGIESRLLSPDTQYRVVFVLKFIERSFGWDGRPIKFSVQTSREGGTGFEYRLGHVQRRFLISGGWMEVVAGKFTVRAAEGIDDGSHIRFRMRETESNQWKGGLLIDGVKIEPCSST